MWICIHLPTWFWILLFICKYNQRFWCSHALLLERTCPQVGWHGDSSLPRVGSLVEVASSECWVGRRNLFSLVDGHGLVLSSWLSMFWLMIMRWSLMPISCYIMITLYKVDVPHLLLYQWSYCTWHHDVVFGWWMMMSTPALDVHDDSIEILDMNFIECSLHCMVFQGDMSTPYATCDLIARALDIFYMF